MAKDDLDHIPSIVPTRDSEHPRAAGRTGTRKPGGKPAPPGGPGGSGIWARLFITLSLVVAAVACAWAWQLQGELKQSGLATASYEQRIADLEDRLSDTDEGLSQNTASMAVKVKEMSARADKNFTEIDKLWAARNKQKKQLSTLEQGSKSYSSKLAAADKSRAATQQELKNAAGDIAKLKSVAGDLERLMTSARANQAEVERVADTLNRIDLEYSKLDKRVAGNEEWVASINAFRRQINAAMTELNASVRALQAAP